MNSSQTCTDAAVFSHKRTGSLLLALLLACVPFAPAQAVLDEPAQSPLLTRSENPAKPNVVFTFDDSGSMAWRFMPDDAFALSNEIRWLMTFHPQDGLTFGNEDSTDVRVIATRPSARTSNNVVCTSDTQYSDCRASDLTSARMRSSAFNTIYYNPEIRYEPWYKADGTKFDPSTPSAARLDPMDATKGSVDLTTEITLPAGTQVCRSATGRTPNSTLTADRDKGPTCNDPTAGVSAAPAYGSTSCTSAVLGTPASFTTGSSGYCRLTESGITEARCKTLTGNSYNWTSSQCRVSSAKWATSGFCTVRLGGVWFSDACYTALQTEIVTPATYFTYNKVYTNGTSDARNFTRVRIRDLPTSGIPRGPGRTDCTISGSTASCTKVQEYQNFANWFTYYRTRNYLSIAASSKAFSALDDGQFRIGYGRINYPGTNSDGSLKAKVPVDGVNARTLQSGVKNFTGTGRTGFFDWLHRVPASGGTPLRRAMDDIGLYFTREDSAGPWGNTPGTNDGSLPSSFLQCRKSYHILMTDGFWNGDSAMANIPGSTSTIKATNVDNTDGPTITGPNAQSYKYVKSRPYLDSSTDTLADVAMAYWSRDLTPNIPNRVKPDAKNPAFWQHMVNFTVGLGVDGDLSYPSDLASIQAGTKNWPAPTANDASAVDDLWHAAVNSRGEYLSAKDPDQFAASLSAILNEITVRNASEGGVAATAATLQAGNRKYVPEYKTAIWTGNLTAYELDQFGQQLSPVWNAEKALTDLIGTNGANHALRNIFVGTRNGVTTKAEPFTWAGMSAGVKADLPGATESLVNYLRGDASFEAGLYRERTARLGDFVNSQPVFVKSLVDMQYNFLPEGTAGRATYKSFLSTKAGRTGVVFIGGNDGMVHAFRDTDGREVFGFIPRILLPNLPALASSNYEHRYYVDGQLTESDAYLGGWKNVLVGSTGAGARAVFALDVTSTGAMGAGNVMWEFDSTIDSQMGYVLAPIEVGLLKNGQWAAVFGNGPNSASGNAYLFIVNLETGSLIAKIRASSATDNGLGGARLIRDANRVVVGAYAGDLKGNVWKFDLSSTNSGSWNVSFGGAPLFQAGSSKPITAPPQYVIHPLGGYMVLVGTGKLYVEGDESDTSQQALYGLWDKQQLIANATTGAAEWSAITAAEAEIASSTLANHSFNASSVSGAEGATYYKLTTSPLNWNTQRGWTLPLTIVSGHRNLLSPTFVFGYALFETMSPTTGGVLNACEDSGSGGSYNLLINPVDGAGPKSALFDVNGDGYVNSSDTIVAGYKGTWDGRDVVLRQKPCKTPSDCPADPENRCEAGTKLVSVQSAIGGNSNLCVDVPPRGRWWWRQIQQIPE